MARVVWSGPALQSLEVIREYLLTVAPERADGTVTLLGLSTRVLAEFPRLGRMLPEYEIHSDTIAIVTVYHAAMDIEARLRRERPDL